MHWLELLAQIKVLEIALTVGLLIFLLGLCVVAEILQAFMDRKFRKERRKHNHDW